MEIDALGRIVLTSRDDERALNELIRDSDPFIRKCAYKAIHRFITDNDDEYSVALSAFNEAINSYDSSKGSFAPFAQMVIRRRLLDYLKVEYRHNNEIITDPQVMEGDSPDEDDSYAPYELKEKNARMSEEQNTQTGSGAAIKDEITALNQILKEYGFGFFDLTSCSPQTVKTRISCAQAVSELLSDGDLVRNMRTKHALPIKELSMRSGISRKILDRHRRYIIAVVEILKGDYPLLEEYVKFIKAE